MADNTGLERSELNRLQQEAIRRAREMQARAQIPSSYAPRAAQGGAVRSDPQEEEEAPPPPPPPPPQPQPRNASSPAPREQPEAPAPSRAPPSSPADSFFGGISGSLDFLLKDSERSMILILLLILMEEKADTSLIFAMMYLLI